MNISKSIKYFFRFFVTLNLVLLDDGSGEIKDHLIDELDYVLLPEEAFQLLVKWYGLTEGQQPITRNVVEYGMFVKNCKVCINVLLNYLIGIQYLPNLIEFTIV